MLITVKVKARAKETKVEEVSPLLYKVSVKALPIKGKANEEVRKILALFFKVSKSCVTLMKGGSSSTKIYSIDS